MPTPTMLQRGVASFKRIYTTGIYLAGTALSFTAVQFNQVMAAFGTVTFDRAPKVAIKALAGATLQAGVLAWQNPESTAIVILRAVLDITTVATGAATVDVGITATNATTTSDTLIDGVDANAAIAVFDSMNAALDSGANAKAQKLASAKWVTITSKTGDTTGMVANLYVEYMVI